MSLTFKLVRLKAEWIVHRVRHERREPYKPEAEDWTTLLELMERQVARGSVSQSDVEIVRKMAKEPHK